MRNVALDCELTFFDLPMFLLLLHTTTAYAVRHIKPIINNAHGMTVIGITHPGVSAGIYIQMHVPFIHELMLFSTCCSAYYSQ